MSWRVHTLKRRRKKKRKKEEGNGILTLYLDKLSITYTLSLADDALKQKPREAVKLYQFEYVFVDTVLLRDVPGPKSCVIVAVKKQYGRMLMLFVIGRFIYLPLHDPEPFLNGW